MTQLGPLLRVLNWLIRYLSEEFWESPLSNTFRLLGKTSCGRKGGCRTEVPGPWLSARDCHHLLQGTPAPLQGLSQLCSWQQGPSL